MPARGATAIAVVFLAIHLVLAPIALPIRARMPGALSRGVDADRHARARRRTARAAGPRARQRAVQVPVQLRERRAAHRTAACRRGGGAASACRMARSRSGGSTRARWCCARPRVTCATSRTPTCARGRSRSRSAIASSCRTSPSRSGRSPPTTGPPRSRTASRSPLEDASLRWRVWRDGAYRPFVPPAVGGAVELPADHFAFGDLLERR